MLVSRIIYTNGRSASKTIFFGCAVGRAEVTAVMTVTAANSVPFSVTSILTFCSTWLIFTASAALMPEKSAASEKARRTPLAFRMEGSALSVE